MHPRVLHRLNETLSARLEHIETLRFRTLELMTGVRHRVDYLERTFGLPLDECRAECDRVLCQIEGLGNSGLPTQAAIEALVQRIIRISAMVSAIDSAGFSRRSRDDGAPGAS